MQSSSFALSRAKSRDLNHNRWDPSTSFHYTPLRSGWRSFALLFRSLPSMSQGKKRYVVRQGRRPWIYETREACQREVLWYADAVYKSFASHSEAVEAFAHGRESWLQWKKSSQHIRQLMGDEKWLTSIATDAACQSNPGKLEWQGVVISTGEKIFSSPVYPLGTVNIGEYVAIIQWIQWCLRHTKHTTIYSDSRTAISWVMKWQYSTQLDRNRQTEKLFSLLDEQTIWLQKHPSWSDKITLQKWPTSQWGEIPADFGRK